jgi:hypothetical protein
LTDIDELNRRTVRTEIAYLAAKEAYLFAVEAQTGPDELAAAARHVVAAAQAHHDADWELHEALEKTEADPEEVRHAEACVDTASTVLDLWEEVVAAHEGRLTHAEPEWRALTAREREVLDFLLADDFPSADELRAQVEVARARRYNRNAPSLEFKVDPLAASPAELCSEPVAVETQTSPTQRAAGKPWYELRLFAAGGYIYQLYCDGEYELDDFPPLDLFDPPRPFPDAEWEEDPDA